jgi:hypothetical protein
MVAQTSYSINTAKRFHGSLSDLRDSEVETYAAEGGDIGFGVVVSAGTADDQAVIGGDNTGFGITIRDLGIEGAAPGDPTIQYSEKDPMSVLRRGSINVAIPAGGAKGAALKYNDTTGVIDAGAPGAGETALNPAAVELLTTVAAGEVGVIRLSGGPLVV